MFHSCVLRRVETRSIASSRSKLEIRTILTVITASFLLIQSAAAAPENPCARLASIPQPALDGAFATGSPVANGLNGFNRQGWQGVGEQGLAMIPVERGAFTGDAAMVERYWPVVEVSFAHQLPDGSFYFPPVNGKVDTRGDATSVGFWIGESALAMLLLRDSTLASKYDDRIHALIPKYRAALLWMSQPSQVADMLASDAPAANRILADAKALLLGDVLVGGLPEAHAAGERMLAAGLSMQSPQGYFIENGGGDSGYNAVSCLRLAEMGLYITDARLQPALERGLGWELARVQVSGQVSDAGNTRTGTGKLTGTGTAYIIDYPHVIRAFAVAGALAGNAKWTDAANRISAYHTQQLRAHPNV
jgi:hypothetical protein